jgi:hypothetical protein
LNPRLAAILFASLVTTPTFLHAEGAGSATGTGHARRSPPVPSAPTPWIYIGLGSRQVARLRVQGDFLYACTDDGLYYKGLATTDTLWTPLGLSGRRVRTVWVATPESILAGTAVPVGDTLSLYRTTDGGAHWEPYQNGFGKGFVPDVKDLAGIGAPAPGWIGVGASIEKSMDEGAHWHQVLGGYVFNFVKANPAAAGHLWAGGETLIFSPVIFRSTDAGDTWRTILLEAGGDNACDAVAFHPSDSAVVYTGMEGRVQRTLDGGDTWEEVTSPNPNYYLYGLAIRGRLPLRIYAAGAGSLGPAPGVILYTSDDEGQSWNTDSYPGPAGYGVQDLLYLNRQGHDWLFLATGSGVYRYVDGITAVTPGSWTHLKGLYRPH